MKSFQDYYPKIFRGCYGCGPDNENGLRIRSFWDGDESVAEFIPEAYHTAFPGYVYGGLIASLVDCHSVGTAAAAAYRAEGREMGSQPAYRYVTGSLQVDYLKPTPLGPPIGLRSKVLEVKGRKVVVETSVVVDGVVTAKGRVVAVRMPEDLLPELSDNT